MGQYQSQVPCGITIITPEATCSHRTRCLLARTYLSIRSSSVTSIIATGGKGLNYWFCNKFLFSTPNG